MRFGWMFLCFAVFIIACGTTHLMEIWNVWHGNYWLSGGVKAVTAMASVPTAFLLTRLVAPALKLPSLADLERLNTALEQEVATRSRRRGKRARLQRRTGSTRAGAHRRTARAQRGPAAPDRRARAGAGSGAPERRTLPPTGRRHAADRLGGPAGRHRRLLQPAVARLYGHAARRDRRHELGSRSCIPTISSTHERWNRSVGTGRSLRDRVSPQAGLGRSLSLVPGPGAADQGCRRPHRALVRHGHRHPRLQTAPGARTHRLLASERAARGRGRAHQPDEGRVPGHALPRAAHPAQRHLRLGAGAARREPSTRRTWSRVWPPSNATPGRRSKSSTTCST